MAEDIYEAKKNEDGKYVLECSSCYYENLLEDPEEDDVYECEDCSAPFTIIEVSDDKLKFQPVVFDEEDWRE